jgi:hypothetical protein
MPHKLGMPRPCCQNLQSVRGVSFNNLVGAGEHRGRHAETDRLGSLEVDDQFVFVGRLYR